MGLRFNLEYGLRIFPVTLQLVDEITSRNLEVVGGEETQIARSLVR